MVLLRAKTQYRIEGAVFFVFCLSFMFLWSPWLVIFTGELFNSVLTSVVVGVIVYIISLALVLWGMTRWYYPHEKKLKERIRIEEEQRLGD